MRIDVVTIFPEIFKPVLQASIVGRALHKGLLDVRCHDLREFSTDSHKSVDDYPYGGGGGMVMMSARGKPYNQQAAFDLAKREQMTIFCGHYKGIDARVDELVDDEISLGDFVLSGGEVPAMAIIDSVCRLLPGAVGDHASIAGDSFYDGILGPPEYTRPEVFRGRKVPEVLVGGNHALIDKWRKETALKLTKERRPDLLANRDDRPQII